MSSAKHDNDAVDLGRPYEENDIQLKGILGFGIGLVLLIVVTFLLMSVFIKELRGYFHESADPPNPMAMTDKERLPPEPRLQLAPGFGVESEKGWKNFELRESQAEYRELRQQWEKVWSHGLKDEKTGAVTVLPIDEAKARFLAENAKAKSGADAAVLYDISREFVSDSSAGRLPSEKRR